MPLRLTLATVPEIDLPLFPDAVDAIRQEAGGEAPSMTLRLPNATGEATKLLDPPPLLIEATVYLGEAALFTGRVQAVILGPLAVLSLEA